LSEFPDALHKRVIRNGDVRPYRLEQFLLGHEATGVLHEIAENFERFGSQVDRSIVRAQAPAHQIEFKAIELKNSMIDMAHSASPSGSSSAYRQSLGQK
jgi:hypothetical protein